MDNTEDITVLSLCAGYGGLELGLARALENPLRVVAVEIEAYALANLVAKAEEGKLAVEALWPDLRTFPAERFRDCFDFVLAGYPCQGESVAGKQLGDRDPRWLWSHIRHIIEAVQPVWCFFENVPNHLNLGYPTVYASLRNMGYKVEAELFTAAECGAPHRRQRLFILAHDTQYGWRAWGSEPEGQQGGASIAYGSSDVAHSQRPEPWLRIRQEPPAELRGHRLAIGGELADAEKQGHQGQESAGSPQAGRCPDEYGGDRWPARPGQPQYEWEEPRVVANASKHRDRCSRAPAKQDSYQPKDGISQQNSEHEERQAQSRVGSTVDGTAARVDQLRLLGNGVVPQQAEKAFRYLIRQQGS